MDILENHESKLCYIYGPHYTQWSYDPDYIIYPTPWIISNQVARSADERFKLSNKVVWDMFAGIGTDALKFGERTGKVICIEIDDDTFHHLQVNVAQFNNKGNMSLLHEDCLNFLEKNQNLSSVVDIIYFDPPWGPSFKTGQPFDFTDVTLQNGMNITDLALRVQQSCHMIIKSPILSSTFDQLFAKDIVRIYSFTQQKLKFLIVSKKT